MRRQLFWTELGKQASIEVADTDGTVRRHFIDQNIYWPVGLTIDYPAKRLYWIDSKLRLVECVNLNGTNRNFVFQFPVGEFPPCVLFFWCLNVKVLLVIAPPFQE